MSQSQVVSPRPLDTRIYYIPISGNFSNSELHCDYDRLACESLIYALLRRSLGDCLCYVCVFYFPLDGIPLLFEGHQTRNSAATSPDWQPGMNIWRECLVCTLRPLVRSPSRNFSITARLDRSKKNIAKKKPTRNSQPESQVCLLLLAQLVFNYVFLYLSIHREIDRCLRVT